MGNIDELYSELGDNSDKIERCEQEINRLEAEIKVLKQKGSASRMEVLQKQLKVSELEGDILAFQDESDRKSMQAIKSDLKTRKSSQYPEYDLLGMCHRNKNELEMWLNDLQTLEIKYKILQQSGSRDSNAYSEITSQIETVRQAIQNAENMLEQNKQRFSARFKKDIDFSKSFTDKFYEYDNEHAPVRRKDDISELNDSISEQYYNFIYNESNGREDDEIEKYRKEKVEEQVSSIFTNGLDGTSKELAQVFSELYIDEIELGIEKNVNPELLGDNPGELSKVIRTGDNSYALIYENDEGDKVGIKCTRNAQTGKIEIQGRLAEDKSLGGLEEVESRANDGNSITREQMKMQVVKSNIEKSMQGKEISEIKEVTDPKIVEYLNEQNNLDKYSFLNTHTRIFMISTQDKEGNTSYEFVAHDSRNSYMKLSGIKQVEITQSHISTEKYRTDGMKYMQNVDCQFVDKNGNSYFVTHPFGNMPMELSVQEAQKDEKNVSNVDTQDFGLNRLFHKTRVNELLRAGYNAMSIGIEKVKSVYKKYRGKEQEQENDINERGE